MSDLVDRPPRASRLSSLRAAIVLDALLASLLAGCVSGPAPTAALLHAPLPTPTMVTGPQPSSDGTMDRANTRGTGVYGGPAMLSPGAMLWKFRVDNLANTLVPGRPIYGRIGSTPAVANGRVYIGGEEYLYGLDAATGKEKWRFNAPGEAVNSPAVAGDTVFFAGFQHLYAVSVSTGVERWQRVIRNDDEATFTDPVVSGGVVYVGSGQDAIYALDAATGGELWHMAVSGSVVYAPAVADGRLYLATQALPRPSGGASYSYAIDLQTRAIMWRIPLADEASNAPAVGNGSVYFTGVGLGLYAIDANTGQTQWRFSHGSINDTPTVAYNTVYVAVAGAGLFALDANGGAERWHFQQNEGFLGSPTIAGDVVYCPTLDWYNGLQVSQPGVLYAVQAETGRQLAKFPVAGDIANGTAIVDGVAYLKSSDGYLYALH